MLFRTEFNSSIEEKMFMNPQIHSVTCLFHIAFHPPQCVLHIYVVLFQDISTNMYYGL